MPWPPPEQETHSDDRSAHRGVGEKDRLILDEWLNRLVPRVLRVWYNVVVGQEPDLMDTARNDAERRWIRATYLKRPDIIIFDRDELWIVEVKPYASYVALGQAIMYTRLSENFPDPIAPIRGAILTDLPDPDLRTALTAAPHITLLELGRSTQPRPSFPT